MFQVFLFNAWSADGRAYEDFEGREGGSGVCVGPGMVEGAGEGGEEVCVGGRVVESGGAVRAVEAGEVGGGGAGGGSGGGHRGIETRTPVGWYRPLVVY